MAPKIRALNQQEEAEIDRYLIHGLELLPVSYEKQEGDFLLLAIQLVLEAARLGEEPPQGVSISDLSTWLGVVWGDELCFRLGWKSGSGGGFEVWIGVGQYSAIQPADCSDQNTFWSAGVGHATLRDALFHRLNQ